MTTIHPCNNCPYRTLCQPNHENPKELAQKLLERAKQAKPSPHQGFGDPLPTLPQKTHWNCTEYARALIYTQRTQNPQQQPQYLLWTDPHNNTHLTPTTLNPPRVLEKHTKHYKKLNYTPVATFPHPPLNHHIITIPPHLAKTLPVLPPDHQLTSLEKLGYAKQEDNHLNTGNAKIYRVRINNQTAILIWHKTGQPQLITKHPHQTLAQLHAHLTPTYQQHRTPR